LDPLRATLLGLLQGLTEFLPISSSGHLALAEALFGEFSDSGIRIFFNVMLHLGTLLAVALFCRREIIMLLGALLRLGRPAESEEQKAGRRLLAAVFLATLPTALIGMAIKLTSLSLFDSLFFVGAMFFITAAVLWVSGRFAGQRREPAPGAALLIGVAQGIAVLPGISRSGMTIVAGKAAGLEGTAAARFAFVISIPAILGAALVSWLDVVGIMAAAFAGYLSLIWLVKIIRQARLKLFAFYCAAIGIVILVIATVR